MSGTTISSRFGLRVLRPAHSAAPSVHIFLQRVVRHANGMLAVTPVCTSLVEMEAQIEELRLELDDMLQQTRRAFREGSEASARA